MRKLFQRSGRKHWVRVVELEREVKFKVTMDPLFLEEELSRDGFARIAT
ncbi:MAG: hypothetical protein ACPLSM_00215, partial [Thermosphaera sp.]